MSILSILKRVDAETTAANDQHGPRPQDAVPLLQNVESKRTQLERLFEIRADTLSKLDAQIESAEVEYERARYAAMEFTREFCGEAPSPPALPVEKTITLEPTKEQEIEFSKREWDE